LVGWLVGWLRNCKLLCEALMLALVFYMLHSTEWQTSRLVTLLLR
jgi:hypothetical protein